MTEPAAEQGRILGVVGCYADLHALMRGRADELEITRTSLDALAGLTAGYAAKLLSPSPMKRLSDETLGFVMPALGMKLVVVEDLQALETIRAKSDRRKSVTVLGTTVHIVFSHRELKRRQKNGGKKRQALMTPKQRSAHARHMATIRWRDVKAAAARVLNTSPAALPTSQVRVRFRPRVGQVGASRAPVPRR